MQDAVRALDAVDLTVRDEVYWALRCTIVSRTDDIEVFDAAFAAFFERAPRINLGQRPIDLGLALPNQDDQPKSTEAHQAVKPGDESDDEQEGDDDGDDADDTAAAVWSADELLRDRDFARYSPEEMRRARALEIGRASGRERV